jgi:hypothetical protein
MASHAKGVTALHSSAKAFIVPSEKIIDLCSTWQHEAEFADQENEGLPVNSKRVTKRHGNSYIFNDDVDGNEHSPARCYLARYSPSSIIVASAINHTKPTKQMDLASHPSSPSRKPNSIPHPHQETAYFSGSPT